MVEIAIFHFSDESFRLLYGNEPHIFRKISIHFLSNIPKYKIGDLKRNN